MKLERRKRINPLIPIASMGDIAFLLIIFFVLTSNFIKESHIKLVPPEAPDLRTLKEQPISISLDEDGTVWVQGEACPVESLEDLVRGLLEGKDEKIVTVKIDKELPQEKFGDVLMSLSRAGAEIALVGTKTG